MNFKNLPILKTERLLLRPATMHDAADIFAYASDPEVSKLLHWYPSTKIEETYEIIKQWLADYQTNKPAPWVIVDTTSHKVIGTIGLHEYDGDKKSALIGYCIARHYWGKGLIPEALQAVINYLFTQTETNEIVAFCRVDNPRSQRVLEKCGFIKQGSKQEEVKGVMATFDRFVLNKIIKI
jgi:ribosomal-protein-alanine N-acetyltransferase